MTTEQFLISGWTWNPLLLVASVAALAGSRLAFRQAGRFRYFAASVGVILLALISPLHTLANGYLFSAHMAQHILLLLVAPALALLGLPASFSVSRLFRFLTYPIVGWISGVGAMWFWHVPSLCSAAAISPTMFTVQTISLLSLGSAFWWQVLAPREEHRLPPLAAIVYLFTACTACSALGIIITFAPAGVCPIFMQPVDRLGILPMLREDWGMTMPRDQQIGGLLMWVPMCLIYVTAILAQLTRWYAVPAPALAEKGR
ncbi:MAG: cytochrome c oxidase assembly protein [Chthoniobacter sp.]|uniref:cytochrome c oxidase assembly protein n=1 Tax=Chthoniobacter sp. TaxID=2510640 RepID=UPI0032A2B999